MRMTVGKKCVAATLVSTALMLAVAGFGYAGLRSVARRADQMLQQEIQVAENAARAKIHLLELRRYEKDLLLNCQNREKVDAYAARFSREQQELAKYLGRLEGLVVRPEDQQLVALMSRELKIYGAGMQNIIQAIKAGEIKTPAAGNQAVMPYKANTYHLDDAAETLAVAAEQAAATAGADLDAMVRSTLRSMLAWSAAAVTVGLLLSLLIGRSIARPLGQVVRMLREVAEGDGDLTRRIDVRRRDEVGEVAECFNLFVAKVHDVVARVRSAGEQVAAAAQQLAASAERLADGAQEQASSLEETAASLEQITSSVKQNADNAHRATEFAGRSRTLAEDGSEVIGRAVSAMGGDHPRLGANHGNHRVDQRHHRADKPAGD